MQTLKSVGAIERGEWEAPAVDRAPAPWAFESGPASRLAKQVGDLRPASFMEVDRLAWSLRRDGSRVELVLDEGKGMRKVKRRRSWRSNWN
jgi:inorganic triphosphatase YgiF